MSEPGDSGQVQINDDNSFPIGCPSCSKEKVPSDNLSAVVILASGKLLIYCNVHQEAAGIFDITAAAFQQVLAVKAMERRIVVPSLTIPPGAIGGGGKFGPS